MMTTQELIDVLYNLPKNGNVRILNAFSGNYLEIITVGKTNGDGTVIVAAYPPADSKE